MLEPAEVAKLGEVCKRWYYLTNADALWKNKCQQFGRKFGIKNLVHLIEANAKDHEMLDWKQAFLELQQHMQVDSITNTFPEIASSSEDDDVNFKRYRRLSAYFRFALEELYSKDKKKKQPLWDEEDEVMYDEFGNLIPPQLRTRAKDRLLGRKKKMLKIPSRAPTPLAARLKDIFEDQVAVEKSDKKEKDKLHVDYNDTIEKCDNLQWHIERNKTRNDTSNKKLENWKVVRLVLGLIKEDEIEQVGSGGSLFAVDHTVETSLAETGKLWLVETKIVPIYKVISLEDHKGPVYCVLCHGDRIYSGGLDRRIRRWSLNGKCLDKMEDDGKGGIITMTIGSDEKCGNLYTGSWDESVSVWDCLTKKRKKEIVGHEDTVSGLAIDAKYIISCSHDGTIRVWDILTYECQRIIKCHDGAVQCLCYADKLIVSGGADKLIHMTDANTGALKGTFRGHKTPVTVVKRQRDLILSGDAEGLVMFWSLGGDGEPMETVKAHKLQINDIALHGGRFFTASSDKLVKEFELVTLTCVRILQGHTKEVYAVKYTKKYLVTCSGDGSIRIWFWDAMKALEASKSLS